jgi:hypothetical protein
VTRTPRLRRAPLLLALAAGCAGAPPPPPRVTPPPATDAATAIVSPARWDYHPVGPSTALSAAKLEGGGCVFTAEGGQRWSAASTKTAGGRLVCAGPAEASAAVAVEDLTSAIRRADGTWIFVGASGMLFEAEGPLGAFTRTVPAPESLSRVAGAGAGVLATTLDGRLLRWDVAGGWRPAATTGPLPGARVFDVVVGDGGRALALGFPEALFRSEDGGATWAPAGAPTVGARLLGRTAGGELGAVGMLETLVWRPGATPAFARGTEKVLAQQAALDVEVGRGATAAAVAAGRAVIDGDRYYEVIRPETEGEAWQLARGRIEGRLVTVPVADSKRCGNLRLGARGRTVYVACVAQDHGEIAAELRRSADGGDTWSERVRLVTPDTDQINLAVAPDGGALVVGVCRASDAGGACKPGAPVRIKLDAGSLNAGPADAGPPDAGPAGPPDAGAVATGDAGPAADPADAGDAIAGSSGGGLAATSAGVPQLVGAALLPAFSPDGRSAYFLGRRGKDDRINLFVSHDGGVTFSPRALDTSATPRTAQRPRDEDEEPSETEGPDTFEVDDISSLRPGEDGTLGMLLLRTRRGDWVYVLADEDGRVLQVGTPPADATEEDGRSAGPVLMSGQGRRVLALPVSAPETGAAVWESLDGGATWERQLAPQAMAREYERGIPGLSCGLGGCLLGEAVTRLGWGGVGGDPGGGEKPADTPAAGAQFVLSPITCELAKAPWARIENAYGGMSYGVPIPGIHEAMRGRAVWSVLTVDRRTGAVATTSALLPESGEGEARVTTRPMLGPKPGGAHLATALSPTQHEGFAAVRVTVPVDARTGQPRLGAPMRGVEVAWENFLEGTSGRARIADAGVFEKDDVALGEPAARRKGREDDPFLADALHAALISISSRGVFVHPHARARGAPAFFVDAGGRAQAYEPYVFPTASPTSGALDLRTDASSVGGELLAVGLLRDGEGEWAAVALGRRLGTGTGATASVTALSLLPPRSAGSPLSVYTSWAWSAKSPVGAAEIVTDPLHQKAWAHFLGFRADGTFAPAEPVPTLLDLGERPRGCSAAERAGTPRVNVPLLQDGKPIFLGARHPVIVREPRARNVASVDDPLVLLTAGAVLQGTPAAPCVAAWEAPAVGHNTAGAVIQGDLAHAFVFRFSYDVPRGKRLEGAEPVPSLEYRPMSCHYDPAAHVPESVWSEAGTVRP